MKGLLRTGSEGFKRVGFHAVGFDYIHVTLDFVTLKNILDFVSDIEWNSIYDTIQ